MPANPRIEVRKLERHDLKAAAELVAKTRTEVQSGGFDMKGQMELYWDFFGKIHPYKRAGIWGAFHGKKLVGVCASVPLDEMAKEYHGYVEMIKKAMNGKGIQATNVHYLGGAAVDIEYRQRGIFKRMNQERMRHVVENGGKGTVGDVVNPLMREMSLKNNSLKVSEHDVNGRRTTILYKEI